MADPRRTGRLRSLADMVLLVLGRDRWGRWILLAVLAVLASVVEVVAGLLLVVLLSMVTKPTGSFELPVVGDLTQRFPGTTREHLQLVLIWVMAGFYLLRACFIVAQRYVQERVVQNAGVRLATRLVSAYLRMPYSFHLQRNSAELLRNSQDAVQVVIGTIFVPVVGVLSQGAIIVGLLAVLLVTAPVGALVAAAVFGPMLFGITRLLQPRLAALGRENHDMTLDTLQLLQQSLQGVREIKLLGTEGFFIRRYERARSTLARATYKRTLLADVPRVALETMVFLFMLGFLLVAVLRDSLGDALPILGLFAYAGLRMLPTVTQLVSNLNDFRFGMTGLRAIHTDLLALEGRTTDDDAPAPDPIPLGQAITFRDVSFTYEGGLRPAVHEVDLVVPAGTSLGIVGTTGGGKSTLVDLMLGLISPTGGQILVDGDDIAPRLAGWQRAMGVVPQSVFLLDDSVRRNIAFGVADDEIDEEALAEAISTAQLDAVVADLPEGLDTFVGERGIRLSGGQRQRIAIARAMYRRPAVLVFDEATSALDRETERAVTAALERLRGERTLVTIAHRLSTVESCDLVVLMQGGRIEARGTFAELERESEDFRRLAR